MVPRWLVTVIVVLITVAWAVNVAVGFFHAAAANPDVNAVFAIVVGSAVALRRDDSGRPVIAGSFRARLARFIAGRPRPDAERTPADTAADTDRTDTR